MYENARETLETSFIENIIKQKTDFPWNKDSVLGVHHSDPLAPRKQAEKQKLLLLLLLLLLLPILNWN
jgi:hypothetical protein